MAVKNPAHFTPRSKKRRYNVVVVELDDLEGVRMASTMVDVENEEIEIPLPDADNRPFWEGCKAHELRIQRCNINSFRCDAHIHYPRPACHVWPGLVCPPLTTEWNSTMSWPAGEPTSTASSSLTKHFTPRSKKRRRTTSSWFTVIY